MVYISGPDNCNSTQCRPSAVSWSKCTRWGLTYEIMEYFFGWTFGFWLFCFGVWDLGCISCFLLGGLGFGFRVSGCLVGCWFCFGFWISGVCLFSDPRECICKNHGGASPSRFLGMHSLGTGKLFFTRIHQSIIQGSTVASECFDISFLVLMASYLSWC